MNWADLIIGFCFGAVIVSIIKTAVGTTHTARMADVAPTPPKHDYVKELEQIEARIALENGYEYVTPPYGMYLGQKVPLNKVTKEMKQSSSYLPPHEMGKWVIKGEGDKVKW